MSVDFLKMVNKHIALKNRLIDLVESKKVITLDPARMKQDDICGLGRLIYDDEQPLAMLPAFEEVRSLHASFHGIASEILRLSQAEQHGKAAQLLHGRFEMVFRKLRSRIILLSQQYNAEFSPSIKSNRVPSTFETLHTPHF
jgi:hypothetical protein